LGLYVKTPSNLLIKVFSSLLVKNFVDIYEQILRSLNY